MRELVFKIAIVVVLVVLLFGRGKISSLMGDVAKGIKSFKKGMSDDTTTNNQDDNSKQTIPTLKINNQNASNWMVRDLSVAIIAILVLGPKEFPIAPKKIGSYIGKF